MKSELGDPPLASGQQAFANETHKQDHIMKNDRYLMYIRLLALPMAAVLLTTQCGATGCPVTVGGDRPGLDGTTHGMAFDTNLTTFFKSSYNDWQYLQVDFGCTGTLGGLRRYMTRDGTNTTGVRATQGEGAQYSLDGITWIMFTATNTTGWNVYTNYGSLQHAWHSVSYGWSAWLNLLTPTAARYVRFVWDGNSDALNELEVNFVRDLSIGLGDFGPAAERMGFDHLALGAPITRQLTLPGLRLRTQEGTRLVVADAGRLAGMPPRSSPFAATTTNATGGIEIRFGAPRQKAGLYFANPGATGPTRAVLRAFDVAGALLGQATVEVPEPAAGQLDNFIGLGTAQRSVRSVRLSFEGQTATMVVDDLLVEPSQSQHPDVVEAVTPWRLILDSTNSTSEAKFNAVEALQMLPCQTASQALQDAARTDADLEVRERSILALTQLRDPDAIAALVSIGLNSPESDVRQAAYQAVWALRRDFPPPNPPQITLEVLDAILPGVPFTVQARLTSPVDQPHVQVRFKGCKLAQPITAGGAPDVFEGSMAAGQEIALRARYVAPETNWLAFPVAVRVSQNLVDASTYEAFLYVDVRSDGGTASMTPFAGWPEPGRRHILPDPEARSTQPGSSARRTTESAESSGERDLTVRGTLLFQDGDPGPNLMFTPQGNPKPGRSIKVQIVELADPDEDYGEGWTSSTGWFSIRAEDVPDHRNLSLLLEVDNFANTVYVDTDVGDEDFLQLYGNYNAGSSGDIDVGQPTVPVFYREVEVDENGDLWWGGGETHSVAFAAAMNVNEVILVARADMEGNRDPNESDSIDHVDVEYGDSAWNHYLDDLVLTSGRINGQAPEKNAAGIDYGFVDSTVAHEYGHHLQFAVGSWDGHDGNHQLCTEIDSSWWNEPEFAWSEGFADYFGRYIAFTKPDMSTAFAGEIETGCGTAGDGVTFVSRPRDPEAWYSVEGHVAGLLWDLADGWGQGEDAWDQVDGTPQGINGHRLILQIFDHELDDGWQYNFLDDAPDLPEFYAAWLSRFPGLNFAAGQPVVDPILNRMGIVPGEDIPGGAAERPFPVIEGNPMVPPADQARLDLPTGTIAQYDPPLATPYTPGQPVLTVRRHWSYLDAVPRTSGGSADRITVRLGYSNLGAVTMQVDGGGSPDSSVFANWSARLEFSGGASNWLAVAPTNGTWRSTNAFDLTALDLLFLPGMQELPGSNEYTADIHLEYQTLTRTESRIVRVILDQITGSGDDPDGDGLVNEREILLAAANPNWHGCLSGWNPDWDEDGLPDGVEVDRYGTSPCRRDTDGDGMGDAVEVDPRFFRPDCGCPCLDPLMPDADADWDGDGLTNVFEVLGAFRSNPCNGDEDEDGALDGFDNCRFTHNPDQADLDGDGRGDACDQDIDGDGCRNDLDLHPTDLENPDKTCLARPTDPLLTRAGRLVTRFDPRLDDPRLHVLLDGYRPQGPDSCGPVVCPPPSAKLLKRNGDVSREFFADQYGFDQNSGFATAAELLPDLDADDFPDLAIGAPQADDGRGAVIVVSGRTGVLLARMDGQRPGEGWGTTMALRSLSELAIGAPGGMGLSGAVYLWDLLTWQVNDTLEKGAAGDRFGGALLPVARDGGYDLLIGLPGYEETGGLYLLDRSGALGLIARGDSPGDEFGAALARVGDLTRDGTVEVLVGAPGASRTPGFRATFDGGDGRAGEPLPQVGEVVMLSLNGQRLWSRCGQEAGERFGSALAALSLGEEPVFEFLVGAPGWQNRAGRAYLLTADGEMPLVIAGENEGVELGRYVAAGPDYDGDGIPSMIIGEPGELGPGQIPGRSTAYQTFSRPSLGVLRRLGNGDVELTVNGHLGVRCQIEISTNVRTWLPLTDVRVDHPNGVVVTDQTAAGLTQRFYRLSAVTSP